MAENKKGPHDGGPSGSGRNPAPLDSVLEKSDYSKKMLRKEMPRTGSARPSRRLVAPARLLQGSVPLMFCLVLDQNGPLAALMLTSTLTGLSFLALCC